MSSGTGIRKGCNQMDKLKMLWTGEYNDYWEHVFEETFDMVKAGRAFPEADGATHRMTEDELIPMLQGKDVFIDGYDRVTERVIRECADLKLILSIRDGPEESVDIDARTKAGLPVLFPGGRCIRSVAELTAALILMCAKPILHQVNKIRNEGYSSKNKKEFAALNSEYYEVYGKTLGMVGLGRNGKELVRYMRVMGMKPIAYDPYCSEQAAEELGVTLMPLDDVLRQADYVVLAARVTPETKRMIGAREFALMKPSACFINTARSELVDIDAFVYALQHNIIRKAATDVYEKDSVTKVDIPLDDNHPYFSISPDRLIMTPHMAGMSVERAYTAYELLKPSYDNFLRGSRELVIKNPEVFDSPCFAERGGKLFGILKETNA